MSSRQEVNCQIFDKYLTYCRNCFSSKCTYLEKNHITLSYGDRLKLFYLNAGFLNDSFLPLILNVKVPVGVGFVGDLKLVSGFNQTYEKYEKETGI